MSSRRTFEAGSDSAKKLKGADADDLKGAGKERAKEEANKAKDQGPKLPPKEDDPKKKDGE